MIDNIIFKIEQLQNNLDHIKIISNWAFDTWGQYNPKATYETTVEKFINHVNHNNILPVTFVAFLDNNLVGMVSIRNTDGIREDLKPWLASLYVLPEYRKFGIAKGLIKCALDFCKSKNFPKCYLLAFDKTIYNYYQKLGWELIGKDFLNDHEVDVMEIKL